MYCVSAEILGKAAEGETQGNHPLTSLCTYYMQSTFLLLRSSSEPYTAFSHRRWLGPGAACSGHAAASARTAAAEHCRSSPWTFEGW